MKMVHKGMDIMNIKIMADSTCDLPAEILEKYNIDLVPLSIQKGNGIYKDGVTITPADIFAHVAAGGALCTTSASNISEYEEKFAKYSKEYDGVIHINIGSGFSSSYQNASIAAENYPNIRVIDSMNLSCGQGMVVLRACRMAEAGEDLDTIANALQEYVKKIEISFVLDRLDYMVKGGRCSSVTMLGANLLNLKPCIELKDGKMSVGKKYRGQYPVCLANYIKDRLKDRTDIDESTLFFVKTQITDAANESAWNAVKEYGHFDETFEAIAGCTVSCHCGPWCRGIMFARK